MDEQRIPLGFKWAFQDNTGWERRELQWKNSNKRINAIIQKGTGQVYSVIIIILRGSL